MSFFESADLAKAWAARVRAEARTMDRAHAYEADIEARTLEKFAVALEHRGRAEKTPPAGTLIPPEAIPTPPPEAA